MTGRSLVGPCAAVVLILARCGAPTPPWIPPGFLWEHCESRDGYPLTIAWPPLLGTREARPFALLVHGGGWTGGRPDEMVAVARMILELGYQPVLCQYRRLGEVPSVGDCVADLRSAWRHIVERGQAIGGVAHGSIVIGGSAGAHLALWAFGGSDRDPSQPEALLLLCPVLDTSPETGFGADRIGQDWQRWSVRHSAFSNSTPVLVLHGAEDAVVSAAATRAAVEAMVAAGGDVNLFVFEDLPHGFYARSEELEQVRELIEAWCGRDRMDRPDLAQPPTSSRRVEP